MNGADDPFVVGGKTLSSRLLLGTGKYASKQAMEDAIRASGTALVTVAMRRIDVERHEDNLLEHIPPHVVLMVNTSGARNAGEAVEIARLFREAGGGDWVKIEIMTDSRWLLPDNQETVKATRTLAAEGFVVLPYMYPDLYAVRALEDAGAAAVMPLGSPIGSCKGVVTRDFVRITVEETSLPVIVDAGIGAPSHAVEAMELGCAAVLVNTAVACASEPAAMAEAFALAVRAGRLAYRAGLASGASESSASSPLTGFLFEDPS
ncbi:MAG: thiazole synthase [Acidobacteria bacterium]|nr:thiazole synthase [Acidobacteriota bacterium]